MVKETLVILVARGPHGSEDIERIRQQVTPEDVNEKREEDGQTLLIIAAKNGCFSAIIVLVEEKKADINVKDNYGKTAFDWWQDTGKDNVVKTLGMHVLDTYQEQIEELLNPDK